MVFLAWNDQPKQYACAWLDLYDGISPGSTGLARPKENEIPFMFKDDKGNTTFPL
jgi:hypothetical protein